MLRRRPRPLSAAAQRVRSLYTQNHINLTSAQRALVERTQNGHVSVIGAFATGKSTAAAERVLFLDAKRDRRVLALGGTRDASLVRLLDQATTFNALERRGHRVAGLLEWTQHTLEELGVRSDGQRVLSFGPLTAFLMHHAHALPLRALHERLATASSLQLRRSVGDMVRFFTTLEAHGVHADAYVAHAQSMLDEHHAELASAYSVYRDLQHRYDVRSWDGLVLDLDRLLVSDPHALDAATREFTDVVIDDLDRLSPAMVNVLSRVLQQPHLQSSTSYSDSDKVERMSQLHALLDVKTPELLELASDGDASVPAARVRVGVRRVAEQVLAGAASPRVNESPVVTCLSFTSVDDELQSITNLIQARLASSSSPPPKITVLCPTPADVRAASHAFLSSGLCVNGREAADATRRRLFDEPGVDTLFSLLVALWTPSDPKPLYNVLRSEFFAFPPHVLSRMMEKHHRRARHATLGDVLTDFVETRGESLAETVDAATLEAAVASATLFLEIIEDCRVQCHRLSVAEIVQRFLERTGHLTRLLDPQTSRDAQQAMSLAAFLREIDAAQRIVESAHVPFVVPYLVQLHAARVVSVVSDDDVDGSRNDKTSVRVLPLTRYDLEELDEAEGADVVVLMGMRDVKFPGRMKRITLTLPTDLMAQPLPIQTRAEFLADAERLVYDALVQLNPNEIVVSYATSSASKKPEKLSRVLEPLWTLSSGEPVNCPPPPPPPSPVKEDPTTPSSRDPSGPHTYEPSHLSYSQITEYARCPQQYYLSRVLGLRALSEADGHHDNLAMMFGSAVHEAMAAFGTAIQRGDESEAAEATAFRVLGSAWRHDGFLSKRQETFFFERAESTLRAFVKRHDPTAEIVAVEQTFECRLGRQSDVPLRGVWDRIDRTADGIVIREFKTNPSAQRRPNQDAAAAESLQLQIYMVAYEQLHGEAPYGATLEVVEQDGAANAVGFVPYASNLRDRVDDVVDATIDAIRKGDFDATPGFLQCALCPYASSVCRANAMDPASGDVV